MPGNQDLVELQRFSQKEFQPEARGGQPEASDGGSTGFFSSHNPLLMAIHNLTQILFLEEPFWCSLL